MDYKLTMPKMGETMTEGTVVKWFKRGGENIKKGEVLCEISTDKAILEIESPVSGIFSKVIIKEGEQVPVDTVIAIINVENDK